jgi:hypothetical protein
VAQLDEAVTVHAHDTSTGATALHHAAGKSVFALLYQ